MSRTEKEISADIAGVEAKMAPLEKERSKLRAELYQFRMDNCGVKVGEIIVAQSRGPEPKKCEAIVREIEHIEWGKPWLKVSFRKQNGEWASRKNSVYEHWEKKT